MKLLPTQQDSFRLQIGLIVLAVLASVSAGMAYKFYKSPYSPLLVAGLFLGIFVAVAWIRKPVLALYVAVLIVFLPGGLIPDTIQSNLNRVLTVVALSVWGISLILQRRRFVLTSTTLLMLIFLLWCLFTVLWADNLMISKYVLGGFALRLILFLFLISNEIKSHESLDGLMHILAIAGWVTILAGVYTIATKGYVVGTRLQIMSENANSFGGLFPVLLVGVIWLAARPTTSHRRLWYYLSLAFILLSFVLIALSGSRGGAISWAITMVCLLLLRPTRPWGNVALLILVAAVFAAPFVLSTTIERFTDTTDDDTLLGGREVLWNAAGKLISDHPWMGVGVGNARYAMVGYLRSYMSTSGEEDVPIHNPVLTIWAETGIPGILLYLGVLISALWSFARQYLRCRKLGVQWLMPYFAATTAALLGYMASWIKGGGIELAHSYFLMLALLIIPSLLPGLDLPPSSLHQPKEAV